MQLSTQQWDLGSSDSSNISSASSMQVLAEKCPPDAASRYDAELRNVLKNCILTTKHEVNFSDVAGNSYLKDMVRENFILPAIMPYLFMGSGKPKPWNKILLYGPPGVGKTMLAQAVCSEVDATCFWVSSSDITSKFMGESEKLLRTLFDLAAEYSPSIIVLDEMDSLGRKRSNSESDSERRLKTEFLRQMDTMQLPRQRRVYVVGTTNMPWELDIAVLRRFERKVLVPMPDRNARIEIFKLHLGPTNSNSLTEAEFGALADLTEGYSGSDISIICNEALMQPVKVLHHATYFRPVSGPDGETLWTPCDEGEPNAVEKVLASLSPDQLHIRSVDKQDFKISIANCKPTVNEAFVELYFKFLTKYGHIEQKSSAKRPKKHLSYYC